MSTCRVVGGLWVRLGKIKCAAICVGLCFGIAALLILRSVGIFSFFLSIFNWSVGLFTMTPNGVLQLGEVAEIEAQMFSFAQKFNRRTELDFSTEPAILPNCCYLPGFCHPDIFLINVSNGPFLNFLLQKILNRILKI